MSEIDDPRLSALYRKAPSSEPAPRSDALIVEAAQKAVRAPVRRRFVRWAVAATLVLGVGIGWRVLHLGPTAVTRGLSQPSPAIEEAAAPPAAPKPSPTAGSRPAQTDGDALHEAPFRGVPGNAAKRTDRLRESAAAAPAADVAQGRGEPPVATRLPEAGLEGGPGSQCSGHWPEGEITVDQWRTLIAGARDRGDVVRLRCLEERYREQFGDQPADVTRPAPGK